MTEWVYPTGRCSRDGWDVCLGAGAALQPAPQWQHTGLRVGHLKTGQEIQLDAEPEERLFVPLAGSYTLTVEGKPSRTYELLGRPHVFAGPTDTVYVGTGTAVRIHCERSGGLAVASCPTEVTHPSCHIPTPAIPVELRGAGACSRQVHNLGVPASDDRPIDVCAEVRSGDVVLVPYGWHGPAMAAPGYDLYYLKVMAGSRREWHITDVPSTPGYAICGRGTPVDERLPFGRPVRG